MTLRSVVESRRSEGKRSLTAFTITTRGICEGTSTTFNPIFNHSPMGVCPRPSIYFTLYEGGEGGTEGREREEMG